MIFGKFARRMFAVLAPSCTILARQPAPASQEKLAAPSSTHKDSILLTVFLKHDQSKTLDQIEAQLNETEFYREFPPAGTEVVATPSERKIELLPGANHGSLLFRDA